MLRECPHCGNWLSGHATKCLSCGRCLDALVRRAPSPAPRPSPLLRTWLTARPRIERLILLLTYADALSVAEIADVLDLGPDYVSETLRVARLDAQEVLSP